MLEQGSEGSRPRTIAGTTYSKGVWYVPLLPVQWQALDTEAQTSICALDLPDGWLEPLGARSAQSKSKREDIADAASRTLKECRAFLKRLASELAA